MKIGVFLGCFLMAQSSAMANTLFLLEGKINLNTATQSELELLPFIGYRKAQNIMRYREKHHFKREKEVTKVKGIGQAIYQSIKAYIQIEKNTNLSYIPVVNQDSQAVNIQSETGDVKALTDQYYIDMLKKQISLAKHRIDILMYIFKTSASKNNQATQLLELLIKKSKQGVTINLVLEASKKKKDLINQWNTFTAKKLTKAGITVRFDTQAIVSHSKLIIIDAKIIIMGSHNWTHSALTSNNETSVFIHNQVMANYFLDYIRNIP